MAMLVFKSCPYCRKQYQWGTDSRGIGSPIKQCPNCKGSFIDTDETEWELKSPIRRFYFYVICAWTALAYGIVVPLGAMFVLNYLKYDIEKFGITGFGSLYLIGVLVFTIIIILNNRNEIKESKERMKDNNYRNQLVKAGLLKATQRGKN